MPGSYIRTITLACDYSNFEGGIDACQRKMTQLDSAMKLATLEAKNSGTEMDALKSKHEGLTQKISLQSQVVDQYSEKLRKAGESGNYTASQLDSMNNQFIKQQTTLESLKSQLNETDAAMTKEEQAASRASKTSSSFGSTIRSLASSMGVQTSPVIDSLASKFDGIDKRIGTAVTVTGVLGAAYVGLATKAAKSSEAIAKYSSQLHMSTTSVQELQYASNLLNVEFDTVAGAIGKMEKNMYSARAGTGSAANAFKTLKLSVTETNGQLKSADEMFMESMQALSGMSNETEKDALSMQIFGKSAKELEPMMNAGANGIKKLMDEAQKSGYVMSSASVSAGTKFAEAIKKLQAAMTALGNTLAQSALPMLTNFISALASINPQVLAAVANIGAVILVIVQVSKAISAVSGVLSTFSAISAGAEVATGGLGLKIAIIIGLVTALAVAIIVLTGNMQSYVDSMNAATESTKNLEKATQSYYNSSGVGGSSTASEVSSFHQTMESTQDNVTSASSSSSAASTVSSSTSSGLNSMGNQEGLSKGAYLMYNQGQYVDSKTLQPLQMYKKSSVTGEYYPTASQSSIGSNASGTSYWRGGLTWVGENGPEVADLPEGTKIYNNSDSRKMSGDSYNITINAKVSDLTDLQKLIQIAKGEKMALRTGVATT